MATAPLPPELAALIAALDAAEDDARRLADGLDESRGQWREAPDRWSIAECLDHLAIANRVYVDAMRGPAVEARVRGRFRRGPALPGIVGRWFVNTMEPPASRRRRMRAPRKIRPRSSPGLQETFSSFLASQEVVRAFLMEVADLDLARVRFPNPFVRGIRFSLATGLHVIPAHERRHLLQAWRVRQAQARAAA